MRAKYIENLSPMTTIYIHVCVDAVLIGDAQNKRIVQNVTPRALTNQSLWASVRNIWGNHLSVQDGSVRNTLKDNIGLLRDLKNMTRMIRATKRSEQDNLIELIRYLISRWISRIPASNCRSLEQIKKESDIQQKSMPGALGLSVVWAMPKHLHPWRPNESQQARKTLGQTTSTLSEWKLP
jgi:hypothetical protein